jgi:hypothetical protein
VGAPHAGDEVVDADSLAASLDTSAATVRSWLYRRELDVDMRRWLGSVVVVQLRLPAGAERADSAVQQ